MTETRTAPRSVIHRKPVADPDVLRQVLAAIAKELDYPVRDVQHARNRMMMLSRDCLRWSRAE